MSIMSIPFKIVRECPGNPTDTETSYNLESPLDFQGIASKGWFTACSGPEFEPLSTGSRAM